jgi:hypothetical protein
MPAATAKAISNDAPNANGHFFFRGIKADTWSSVDTGTNT